MPEPQPDDARPAAPSLPSEPPVPAPEQGEVTPYAPAQRADAEAAETPSQAADDADNADNADNEGGGGGGLPAGAGEQPTEIVAPRWTGSAAVPPSKKKGRWLGSATEDVPGPPAPRDPTLELPSAEREALESGVPVDPWADAAADAWAAHGGPYPPVAALPQALPYPAPPPQALPYPAPPPQALPYPAPPPRALPPARPASAARSTHPPPATGLVKPPKRGRREPAPPPAYGPPQPPPPGWRAPAGWVPVAVRRRPRWPWVLMLLTLLAFGCCCAGPAYYLKPMSDQYPATAALPATVADLSLLDDVKSQQTAQQLKQDMRVDHLLAEDTFAGIYRDPDGKRVTIFGTTGFRFSPDQDLAAEMTRLTADYQLTDVRAVDTGTRGEYQQCGTGRANGTPVVLCSWADHGSLAAALFTGRSVDESARLLSELRDTIVARG